MQRSEFAEGAATVEAGSRRVMMTELKIPVAWIFVS